MKKSIIRVALITLGVLIIPIIANQVVDGFEWSPFDFVFIGVLLFATGMAFELVSRKSSHLFYKAGAGIAILSALLMVWANAAVGLIGKEGSPINTLYFGVLVVGLVGAYIASLEPRGMGRAMLAMAGAQILVPIIGSTIWGSEVVRDIAGVIRVTAFFVILFVTSAVLFRASATEQTQLVK